MIKIISLQKKYGNVCVFTDINLVFKPAEVHGIIGENGAGKTTLFKCISGLETYKGKITYEVEANRKRIGFLEATPFMLHKITGKEYLRLLCDARDVVLDNIAEKNIFDLPLDRYASAYSTGMKKKLALTGVLLQKNEIFILDEPFSGVDIQSNILIEQVIAKLKSLGKTVILSSHTFSTLEENCDYLHLLKDGVIKNSAPKGQFLSIEQDIKQTGIEAKIDRLEL